MTQPATPRRALFLFPTDTMGGAENVLRLSASAALASGDYDEVVCFVLCRAPSGALDTLAGDKRVTIIHTGAASEKAGLPALAKVLRDGPWEFVMSSHTHLNAAASLARRVGWFTTERLVTRESTMIFEREFTGRGRIAPQLYRAYGGQDLLVCQSQRMADSLAQHTKDRLAHLTRVIENPLDMEALEDAISASLAPTRTDNRCKIVWCGRLAEVKSPDRALATLAELDRMAPGRFHLTMIGDGPMRTELENRALHDGLQDAVTFTGRVASPAPIMAYCDIGLLTSDIEGYPNVIPEMLACGVRRVVTTNCAGGLDALPGVIISHDKTPAILATALLEASASQAAPPDLQVVLESRSPERFFERLLAA
ncbi:glycosyltransferase [Ahrensia sp. R2A130]|uniref:glycosyltransferase n=1 Tax=Ahrensia sp. R2A130 TaxID=744979 RepID=UPI0001E08C90|nr:glycosyltransferase [Ahrensia sp. R2A130]EFL89125.1 putative glycosyl transferase, group 1 [Ahrensia sp. R2A130]